MPEERRLTGVVTQLHDLGEADRIVELVTREAGRVRAVARGARASRRRFAGVLDLCATVDARLRVRPELWVLESATLRDARLGLRQDYLRIVRAAVLVEAARQTIAEHQAGPAAYAALSAGLDALASGNTPGAVTSLQGLLAAAGISSPGCAPPGDAEASLYACQLLDELERYVGQPLRSRAVLRRSAVEAGW